MSSRTTMTRVGIVLALGLVFAGAGGKAAHAEVATPTTQAIAANAQFLAYAPAPPVPATACFVDTGLHPNPDTQGLVLHSEALDPEQSAQDTGTDMHGSRGVMTAFAPINGWGAVGMWPQGRAVTINALPAGSQTFPFSYYRNAITRCVQLATAYSIRVIVLSLSASTGPDATQLALLADAVDHAHAAGLSVVAAAGNAGADVEWPAAYDPVFAVGAADDSGTLCSFSARGTGLDVLAPGCSVQTALADTGAPVLVSGTSSADDIDAAVLLALDAYHPDLTWTQSEQLVRDSAHNSNIDARAAFLAAGLADVVADGERAAAAAHPTDAQVAPATPPPTTDRATPRRSRAWSRPHISWHIRGRQLVVAVRARPRGARLWLAVVNPGPRATVRTLARRTTTRDAITLKLPQRDKLRLMCRYLADRTHLQSATLSLRLR